MNYKSDSLTLRVAKVSGNHVLTIELSMVNVLLKQSFKKINLEVKEPY